MKTKMKAVMFYAPKEIRLVEVPLPRPGRGEVLLKVEAALTCGTDFKAYRQGHPVLLGNLPAPFGHELAGTVVETGKNASDFKPGDRVAAANSAPCYKCFYCSKGQTQLCSRMKLHNGAYAEFNLVPAQIVKHNLHHIAKNVDFHLAALSEPLACAIHAVDTLHVREEETAVIIGSGTMSILLIHALIARGARVLVIGRDPENLKKAAEAGAHETFSTRETDVVDAVRRRTRGWGADHVFEAVGKAETWETSIKLVRKGGRVCLFGGCSKGTYVPVDAHRLHYGQITLYGVFHHTPKYYSQALKLISENKIRTDLIISNDIRLSDVPAFFDKMHHKSNPKVAVIP